MTSCIKCGATVEQEVDVCPECGAQILPAKELVSPTDEELLAKDRWSVTTNDSPSNIFPDPLREKRPSGAGYEGTRGRKQELDQTMGLPYSLKKGIVQTLPIGKRLLDATIQGVAQKNSLIRTEPSDSFEQKDGPARGEKSPDSENGPKGETGNSLAVTPDGSKLDLGPSRIRVEPSISTAKNSRSPRPAIGKDSAAPVLLERARARAARATRSLLIGFGVAAAVFICSWFVPHVWTDPPVFPFRLVGAMQGAERLAMFAEPFVGALLLGVMLAPLPPRSKAYCGVLLGSVALLAMLLLRQPSLPIDGAVTLLVATVSIIVSVLLFARTHHLGLSLLVMCLVPGILLCIAAYAVATDRLSILHLSAFKAPLNIFAAIAVTTLSGIAFIEIPRRPLN